MNPNAIEEKIFRIRGKRVMLDRDLAALYRVDARALRQQVKRNIERFPPDFMFTLTPPEIDRLVSQNVTPSRSHLGGHRPFAFTQEGIAMLSGVLRSSTAVQINIAIMRAFVKLRHALTVRRDLAVKVERIEGRLGLVETDVRLFRQEIRGPSPKEPFKPLPRVRGFEALTDTEIRQGLEKRRGLE